MENRKPAFTSVEAYISSFPEEVQTILQEIRAVIKAAAPEAKEKISYGIPTFTLNGNLVHFGAYKNHIGFYPAPSGIEAFKEDLSVYVGAKGTVRFPLDKPIPYGLISRIVAFRVEENLQKGKI